MTLLGTTALFVVAMAVAEIVRMLPAAALAGRTGAIRVAAIRHSSRFNCPTLAQIKPMSINSLRCRYASAICSGWSSRRDFEQLFAGLCRAAQRQFVAT